MPARQKALLHSATALVGLSGVAFGWMRYLLPDPEDPFSVVRHPLQPWALDLHVLSAPLFLLAVGVVLKDHILARLGNPRRRRGRRSGAMAALLLLPMVASGYLLQTATSESWRFALLMMHLITGCLFLGTYLVHLVAAILAVRRRRAMTAEGVAGEPHAFEPSSLHLRGTSAGAASSLLRRQGDAGRPAERR
jgi:hypothetical protein